MRYLIFISLFFLSNQLSFAQNKADSLTQELHKSKDKDKAYIYYQLAKDVFYKNTNLLISYSRKADSLADIFQIDSTKINALNLLSYGAIHTGKLKNAIKFNQSALELSKLKELKKEHISSQFFRGYLLYATGQTDSSLYVLNQAYTQANLNRHLKIELQCLNTIAANYLTQGKYNKAINNFTKAYELADSLMLYDKLIHISLNIGTTFLYNEELDKAIEYFEKVISSTDSLNINLAYAAALNNLGACYSRRAKHSKALVYFEKALPAYQKLNNKLQIAQTYTNLGQTHFFLNNSELAYTYLQNSNVLNRQNKTHHQLVVNLLMLARLNISQENFMKAKYQLNEALELANKHNINYNKADLYLAYSLYYSGKKDFKNALEYKQKELNLKDSIFDITRQQQISELETKFETKQKSIENESLRKDITLNQIQIEKQDQKNRFWILFTFISGMLILILLNRARVKKQAHTIIQSQKLELERLNKTKDKFFSIIAHDLRAPFNALVGLSSILESSYDMLSDTERKNYINDLNEASKSAYGLLENLLTWSRVQSNSIVIRKENINISELISECVRPYVATAKLKNISIIHSSSNNITVFADPFCIKTIILNLINNAIKFTKQGGSITLSAQDKNGQSIISVSDNGIGMDQDQIEKLFKIDQGKSTLGTQDETGTGLGLVLCHEFIKKNNGEIWVDSTPQKGSTFSFSIKNTNS